MNKFLKDNNFQIFRFIISGSIASTINFIVYNSSYLIFRNIIFSSLSGYSMGLIASFIFAKIWVFTDNSNKRIIKSFFIFSLIYILGGLEMSLIIIYLNYLLNDHLIAWLFGAFIGSLNNYLGSKYFLFRD